MPAGGACDVAINGRRGDSQVPGDLAIGHPANGLHEDLFIEMRELLPVGRTEGLTTEGLVAVLTCKPLDTVWCSLS